MKFDALNLSDPILRAVKSEGYETPTPIQAQAIPLVLERKDVLACAQTGTGKTAAFALPILQLLSESESPAPGHRPIRVLVLTPTRELASQISKNFSDYGKELPFRNAVIFGGVNQKSQVKVLRQGLDILIATPGRLLDLMQQKQVQFQGLEILVLDEADRMLDMGFIRDVRRIISALPKERQTLFFSATMPPEIRKLSEQILFQPVRIEVTPVSSTAEKIDQSVYHVEKKQKTSLLIRVLEELGVERGLVFTRTKRDANRVSEELNRAGIRSNAIHGNKSQDARERALASIKKGECRVLVATDIAARGIDIDKVTHVFNHDIPNVSESYVHRIGRTARAGCEGSAYSFCSGEERKYLSDIERLIRKKITVLPTPEGLAIETRSSAGALRPPRGRPKKTERFQQRSGRSNSSENFSNPAPKRHPRPHRSPVQTSGHGVMIRSDLIQPKSNSKPIPKSVQSPEHQQKPIHHQTPTPSQAPSGLSRRERRRELQLKWQQAQGSV
jgi:ATP-dependent RNA helicase RhlE